MENLLGASQDQIDDIPEVGEIMAQSVYRFLHQPLTKKLLESLQKAGLNMKETTQKRAGKLSGKKFVFTGELNSLSRMKAVEMVHNLGAKVIDSVSQGTDFVVVGDNPGSKYQKAVTLGVKILDLQQFMELLNE
jgi:DNA ligase (NAD+)